MAVIIFTRKDSNIEKLKLGLISKKAINMPGCNKLGGKG